MSGTGRPRYIVLVGAGKSGSSAVFDYLAGRPDVVTALAGKEFKLGNDPGGLGDLGYALGPGFHPNRASVAVKRFEDLCRRYGRPRSGYPPGLGYSTLIPDYDRIVGKYLGALVEVEYRALPRYELTQLGPLDAYLVQARRRIYKRMKRKPLQGVMKLPVSEDKFAEITSAFVDALLLAGVEYRNRPLLVNQGGSYWRPLSSTEWFGDRHVITVKRDPRDVYSDFKSKGYGYPGEDIDVFIRWYRNVMERVSVVEWKSERVVAVQFERITAEPGRECGRLNERLGLDPGVSSSYDLAESARNVGLYKLRLDGREAARIEKDLAPYLQPI